MSSTINRDISGIDFGDITNTDIDVDNETNTTNNNNGNDEDESNGSVGYIVGMTLSLVLALGLLIAYIIYFIRYKKCRSQLNELESQDNSEEVSLKNPE